MNFEQELDKRIIEIEKVLMDYLPKQEGYYKTVIEAMSYSILAGETYSANAYA